MSWWRTAECFGCRQAEREIEYLRGLVQRMAEREHELLDRYLAVVDRQALAAVVEARNPTPPRTWATDETGTSLITPQGEREVLFNREGEPCVQIDGELVKVSEYDHWMQRLHQEASGLSPGSE